jgi:hypothetical protein
MSSLALPNSVFPQEDPSSTFHFPSSRLKLKAVYMYAAGFYTYSIFALLFWETRRSDFGVSMSHHIATVVLIILSYIFRYFFNKIS